MFSYFGHCIYSAIQLSGCKCVLNKLSCQLSVVYYQYFPTITSPLFVKFVIGVRNHKSNKQLIFEWTKFKVKTEIRSNNIWKRLNYLTKCFHTDYEVPEVPMLLKMSSCSYYNHSRLPTKFKTAVCGSSIIVRTFPHHLRNELKYHNQILHCVTQNVGQVNSEKILTVFGDSGSLADRFEFLLYSLLCSHCV